MGRFETVWLIGDANLAALTDLSGARIDRVHACKPQTTIVLDMDSSVSKTPGAQEGSAYHGYFACTCYRPLFVFNQFGDLERCALRPGNVHSADGWRDVLEPVVARYRDKMTRRYRTLAFPDDVKHWSMTALRDRLMKIGARIVRHGRSITFQMAEVMVPRALFQKILAAIAALRPLPPALR